MEVCGFCGRLSANCPVGRDTAGERRQTEGMGCARTGSALLACHLAPVIALLMSLLLGHSLTADLWVTGG